MSAEEKATSSKDLLLAISTLQYPKGKGIKPSQANNIMGRLKNKALQVLISEDSKVKPELKNVSYDEVTGCVMVECADMSTRQWVCKFVPRMKETMKGGIDVKVVGEPEVERRKSKVKDAVVESFNPAAATKGIVVAISSVRYPDEQFSPYHRKIVMRSIQEKAIRDKMKHRLKRFSYNEDTGCMMVECADEKSREWLYRIVPMTAKGMKGCPNGKVVTEPVSIKDVIAKGFIVNISSMSYPKEHLDPKEAMQVERFLRDLALKDNSNKSCKKKPILRDIHFDSGTGCLMVNCADKQTRDWVFKVTKCRMRSQGGIFVKAVQRGNIKDTSSYQNSTDVPQDSDDESDMQEPEDFTAPQGKSTWNKSFNNQTTSSGNSSGNSNRREDLNSDWNTSGHSSSNRNTTGNFSGDSNSFGGGDNSFNERNKTATFDQQGRNKEDFTARQSKFTWTKSSNNQTTFPGNSSGNSNRREDLNSDWNTSGHSSSNRKTTGNFPGDSNSFGGGGNSFNERNKSAPFGEQGRNKEDFTTHQSKFTWNKSLNNQTASPGNSSGNSNRRENLNSDWNTSGHSSSNRNTTGNFSGDSKSAAFGEQGRNNSFDGGNWTNSGDSSRSWNRRENISDFGQPNRSGNSHNEGNSFNRGNKLAGGRLSRSPDKGRYDSADGGNWNSSGQLLDKYDRRSRESFTGSHGRDRSYGGEYSGGNSNPNRSFDSRRHIRFE